MRHLLCLLLPALLLSAPEPLVRRSGQPGPGEGLDYLVYLPADYARDAARRWPLVVFLHGIGERGENVQQVRRIGLTRRVESRGGAPYILVAPQCPPGRAWEPKPLGRMLDQVLSEHRADARQVILTGLSWGGMGTWRWGVDQPERFAALVPICGGASASGVGALKGMPIWAFHGDADTVVPLEGHRRVVEAAKQAGAQVRFTVYNGVGHNSWDRAYADPSLEEWMLAQRRR
jgi:predicted peptidase